MIRHIIGRELGRDVGKIIIEGRSVLVHDLASVESVEGAIMALAAPVAAPHAHAEWHLKHRLYALSLPVSRALILSPSAIAPVAVLTPTPQTPIFTEATLTGLELEFAGVSYLFGLKTPEGLLEP